MSEYLFKKPGLMSRRMILGTTVFLSTLIVIFNLAVDIAYGWLDPRIGTEGT